MDYNHDQLEEWLRRNTKLAESSISRYMNIYSLFYRDYEICSIANLKEFISKKNREHNMMHIRAPWLYFFKYKGMPDDKAKALYDKLPQLTNQPIKRPGTYLSDNILLSLLGGIKDQRHRDISILRYHTGIRIFEALTIREEMLSREIKTLASSSGPIKVSFIKIVIQTKRGGNRTVFLTSDIARPLLQPYTRSSPGFLFLPRHFDNLSQAELFVKVQSEKNRYNESLQAAAIAANLGQPFASHDIRRNYAERCRRSGMDLELTRRMMGHSRITTTVKYFEKNPEDVALGSARLQGVT